MHWWHEFESRLEHDADLGRLTWFRIGGRAKYLFRPSSVDDLASMISCAKRAEVPLRVLGRGANVLIRDQGFGGVVVRLEAPEFRRFHVNGGGRVEVGAGLDLTRLARTCSVRGLAGLECMAGIPASVGGAVRMNAGGRFGEFGQVVQQITVLRRHGAVEEWDRERVGFSYRHSEVGDSIVLSAVLELREDDPAQTRQRFDEYYEYKMRTQPLADQSAGCIFRNPPNGSAGAMIDQAGLKGHRCGGAHVSERHANFIVADEGASASDVLRVIEAVQARVRHAMGVELDLEIDIW